MSDARKFCTAYFVTIGLLAAGANHGWFPAPNDGAAGLMALGSAIGSVVVIFFGQRAS